MKMEQLDQVHHLKQQIHTPTMFNLMEPSIIRTQFAAKRDPSFNSYLRATGSSDRAQTQLKTRRDSTDGCRNRADGADRSSVFDAGNYLGDLNDDAGVSPVQSGSSKVVDLTAVSRLSSVSSSVDGASNYRARSFRATPTGSSEASWNSRTGLMTNGGRSSGVSVKSLSPNPGSNDGKGSDGCKRSTKWSKIMHPKWLIPPRKCPCSGKKSVQVEERMVEVKTPRMVDLRRSPSSGSRSNASSFYSTRQSSPCNRKVSGSSKVVDSLKLVVDHGSDVMMTSGITGHGFTFPIMDDDQPVAVKKMFNVISSDQQKTEPSRDSLGVFQPTSQVSPRSRRMSYEDENVSDVSSDLFEIENFTTTFQCNGDSIDDNEIVGVDNSKKIGLNEEPMMDVVASNECKAPSKVSAEGCDRDSFTNFSVSESEIGSTAMEKAAEKNGGGGGGGVGEDEGNLLMSCRCEKVVGVGRGPIKCPTEGPTVKVARHVGGGPNVRQERKLDMVAQDGNDEDGKVGLVVGMQRKV